ncbi:hypothetical protein [Priestia filamentosa]|uniref:hypothetical protein n=1 Tax=Priestia filamentosa TaxID=1402861 RepID=UPI000A088460|nr:hypothetical protein [Priestia filamentosa]OXS72078.1 hypothetical protein B1B01_07110 [Priestia filamentosa]SMF18550.1 hypothetical protein SAMN06296056_1011454 [Priestia filamentosa]
MSNIKTKTLEPITTFSDIETFKAQLRLKTHQYGSFSFEDDEWYFEKLHNTSSGKAAYTIFFSKYPIEYRTNLKYFTLMLNDSVSVRKSKVSRTRYFLDFFKEHFSSTSFKNTNRKILNYYEEYLRQQSDISDNEKSRRYAALIDFFPKMSNFSGFPKENPTKNKNPFHMVNKKHPEKYIPTEVVKQFDKIMKDERHNIPTSLRLAYWLQRSFPNRITEVTSIPVDCLKSLYNMYIINIPSTKQNGGYIQEEIKTIPVINSGHGKYIVELIKRAQAQTKMNLEAYPIEDKDKNFLLLETIFDFKIEHGKLTFTSSAYIHKKILEYRAKYPSLSQNELSKKLIEDEIPAKVCRVHIALSRGLTKQYSHLRPFDSQRFNSSLNKIAALCNVKDENGKIYKISSHQFRHNATTDRLYIGGYTMDQALAVRHDKSTSMPMQYVHQQREMHKKMWLETNSLKPPTESPVEFKGRIMNLSDKKTLSRLSGDPKMYLTWEANSKKGVGLCSMISGCKPDGTSIHFECYECNWFVPKAEYLEDYKKEMHYWEKLMNTTAGHPKRAATFENATRNVNCLERIIRICENGIDKYKAELEEKVKSGVMN